jgi:hypothetical protein
MKNVKNKCAKTLRVLAIVALVAVIGFATVACDDGSSSGGSSSGYLSAPRLTYSSSGTTISLSWSSVSGAAGYNLYVRAGLSGTWSGWDYGRVASTSYSENLGSYVGYSFEFKVAAVNSSGTEGAMSNTVSITVGGGSTSYTIEGTWEFVSSNSGVGGTPGTVKPRITVSGSSGYLSRAGNSPCDIDAMNKGFFSVGSQMWRNLSSTGTNKWSGQSLTVLVNTKTPDVAHTAQWFTSTFTLSSNGQTLTEVTPWSYQGSSGTGTSTWKRVN